MTPSLTSALTLCLPYLRDALAAAQATAVSPSVVLFLLACLAQRRTHLQQRSRPQVQRAEGHRQRTGIRDTPR